MALLVACASPSSRFNMVTVPLPPERIFKEGYSLMPLNEEGWILGPRNETAMALAKRGSAPDETHAIRSFIKPLPKLNVDEDFVVFAESAVKMESATRYEVLKHATQRDNANGQECVKVRDLLKDFQARKTTKNPEPMILDSLYWVCKHPDGKNAVIIGYSDRYYAGHEDPAFDQKAETVFRGLAFVPSRQ